MKRVKIRSIKYPDPAINWDFEASDEEYQAKLDSILSSGADGIRPERIVVDDGTHVYHEDDVIERIPEIIESREIIVDEVLENDEIIETIESSDENEPVKYKVLRDFVLEKAKVKLRAEYIVEIEDITQELQQKEAERLAKLAIQKGQDIVAKISARNALKGINVEQTLAFVQAFGQIAQLLQLGALQTAKEQIQALTPNELVTQDDIDYALSLFEE